jgi:predicted alpha/beta hydrolase family esterase
VSFLIVHGFANHRPPEHWQHWLAGELRRRGCAVRYPQLPDPDAPRLERWLRVLADEYARLGDDSVVICHSLGCVLWYDAWRREVIRAPASRVMLVAPPGPAFLRSTDATSHFSQPPWEAAVLQGSSRTTIRLVASDADPYAPEGPSARLYGEPLGLDAETVVGAGHFAIDDGYGPWPAMLAWCADPTVRFATRE